MALASRVYVLGLGSAALALKLLALLTSLCSEKEVHLFLCGLCFISCYGWSRTAGGIVFFTCLSVRACVRSCPAGGILQLACRRVFQYIFFKLLAISSCQYNVIELCLSYCPHYSWPETNIFCRLKQRVLHCISNISYTVSC